MSPEQAAGRWDVIDHRTDVYGVGAVLYSVLSGKKPLQGDNWPELQQKIQQGDFAKPRSVKPGVDEPLEAICLKAMALRPEQRYGSVLAIANDIEHWLADEPVTAYSEPLLTRGRRWIKRHRSLVAAAAGLLLATVIGLSVGLFLLERKNREVTNQRTIAENAKQKAEALNRFLTDDLLKQADPANNPVGNKMTVRELLDKAAAGVDSPAGLANVPEVEAEIRTVLGQAYQNLGAADEAVRHYRRAWEIRSSLLGSTHVDALATRNDYVYTIVDRDLSSEAFEMAKKAFEDCEAVLGPNHPESAKAMASYGSALINQNKSIEAESMLRRASEKLGKVLGTEHRATLEADNTLAVVLGMTKRAAESERLLANIVQRRRKIPRDPELALAISNHGFTLLILGRFQDAEAAAKEAIEVGRKTVGDQAVGTLQAQNLLAYAFETQSRWTEAEEQFLAVLQIRRALPPTAFDLQRSLGFIARMYAKQEKWSESAKYLAELLIAQNPDSHRDLKQLALDLEKCLIGETPAAAAQTLLFECLEGARKPLWSGDWLLGELASRYGDCLRRQEKFQEAEPILLEAAKEIAESIAPPVWSQVQSRKRLHQLYLSWGKTSEADKWLTEK